MSGIQDISIKGTSADSKQYATPLSFRKIENLHIVFWLFKDLSWCMLWRPLGMIMIIPTLYFAILITVRTKKLVSELCHNLAIVFWITANAYWMTTEFFHFEGKIAYASITYKHLAIIPFLLGILILTYYYIWWKPRNNETIETM